MRDTIYHLGNNNNRRHVYFLQNTQWLWNCVLHVEYLHFVTSLFNLYIYIFSEFSAKRHRMVKRLRCTTPIAQTVVRVHENTAPNSFYTYLTQHPDKVWYAPRMIRKFIQRSIFIIKTLFFSKTPLKLPLRHLKSRCVVQIPLNII